MDTPRMAFNLHAEDESSEAAFRSACFKFLQHRDAAKALEVLNGVIETQKSMQRTVNRAMPDFEPSFTSGEPAKESPRDSAADAARIHDTPTTMTMDWLGPQFDAISQRHTVNAYPMHSSLLTSGMELARNMELETKCPTPPQVSFMSFQHKHGASGEGMSSTAKQEPEGEEPVQPTAHPGRDPSKAGIGGAVDFSKDHEADKQTAPLSNPAAEKDDLWVISTQTTFGSINLYKYVQMVWGVMMCLVVIVLLFENLHTQYLGFDTSLALPPVPGLVYKRLRNMLWGIVPLSKPYFWSEKCWTAWGYGFLVFLLMFIEAFLDLGSTLMLNCWTSAMFAVDFQKIIKIFMVQIVSICAKTFAIAYRNYIQTIIGFQWRESLAGYISNKWLKWHMHYFMHLSSRNRFHSIDNPEQRIQEDVRTVVHQMIEMGEILLRSVFCLLLNVPVLYALVPPKVFGTNTKIPGWPLYLCIFWCFSGGVITHLISNILISINWLRAREEAFYRDRIGSVRRHSEAIAVGACEPAEGQAIGMQYDKVKFLMWKGGLWQKRLTWWFQLYKDIGGKLAFLIFIPNFMNGDFGFGAFAQAAVTLIMITEAIDIFATNYYNYIATWRAASDRVLQFLHVLDELETVGHGASTMLRHGKPMQAEVDNVVKADFDVITTPGKEIIWNKMQLDVPRGQKLLISGGDGDGKSTIFRVLSGIWPYFNGGRVTFASWVETLCFVPENVLVPPLCSLRAALSYPEHSHFYGDEDMETVLRAVGLSRLLQEEWYMCLPRGEEEKIIQEELEAQEDAKTDFELAALDRVASWYNHLSPEMLQRLSFAHALLKRPQLLVLDGPLSSVNKRSCAALYKLLPDYLPSGAAVISISHDVETYAPLHDKHLTIKGLGIDKQLASASWLSK